MPQSPRKQPAAANANEGEGSRTAAHRYEEGVKRTIQAGHVPEKAAAAARAIAGPEGPELRRAEAAAKQRKSPAGAIAHDTSKKR